MSAALDLAGRDDNDARAEAKKLQLDRCEEPAPTSGPAWNDTRRLNINTNCRPPLLWGRSSGHTSVSLADSRKLDERRAEAGWRLSSRLAGRRLMRTMMIGRRAPTAKQEPERRQWQCFRQALI